MSDRTTGGRNETKNPVTPPDSLHVIKKYTASRVKTIIKDRKIPVKLRQFVVYLLHELF